MFPVASITVSASFINFYAELEQFVDVGLLGFNAV
jgi:hypothetical protein